MHIIGLLQRFDLFPNETKDKAEKHLTDAEAAIRNIFYTLDITTAKQVLGLRTFFEATSVTGVGDSYGHVYPLACIYQYYAQNPALLSKKTLETPTLTDLQKATFGATKSEPKIHILELPAMPKDQADWFAWRYEVEALIDGCGAGKVLTDSLYAAKYHHTSRLVHAMLVKSAAKSVGFPKAQWLLESDILTSDTRCGYHTWQSILKIFEVGDVIRHHLRNTSHQIETLQCGHGLANYMDFVQEFLSLKARYTYLSKSAETQGLSQGVTKDWLALFKERIMASPIGPNYNAVSQGEHDTLSDRIQALYSILYNTEESKGGKGGKRGQTPKSGDGAAFKEKDSGNPGSKHNQKEKFDNAKVLKDMLLTKMKTLSEDEQKQMKKLLHQMNGNSQEPERHSKKRRGKRRRTKAESPTRSGEDAARTTEVTKTGKRVSFEGNDSDLDVDCDEALNNLFFRNDY